MYSCCFHVCLLRSRFARFAPQHAPLSPSCLRASCCVLLLCSNGLEDLLAIGRAAGLPVEAAERAVESSGFSFSNVSGCSSSTARAAAGHLVKGMTKGPKNTAKSSGKNVSWRKRRLARQKL